MKAAREFYRKNPTPLHEMLSSAEPGFRQFDDEQLAQYAAISRPDRLALLGEKDARLLISR